MKVQDMTKLTDHESLHQWARQLPKIELHRHLEGSLRLHTLTELAREHGIALPSYDLEQLRPYVQITDDPPDFHHFLSKFRLLRRMYTSKEAVQRVAREAIFDAAQDNVRYLELRFNPVALSRAQNFPMNDVVEWVEEATLLAQEESGTRTCLILQIGRDEPLEIASEIVDIAIAHHGPLIRGLDLAGDEVNYPPGRFEEPFQRGLAAGLHVTVHAGEACGAQSILDAITYLGAERIGHGIRAVENSNVISLLHERKIALEVCPTSNIQTGVVQNLSLHPLADLFNLRVRVTLNTDDPSISDIVLSDEYVTAIREIGLTQAQIYRTLRYAADAAFIPEEERETLRQNFRRWLAPYPGAVAVFDQP